MIPFQIRTSAHRTCLTSPPGSRPRESPPERLECNAIRHGETSNPYFSHEIEYDRTNQLRFLGRIDAPDSNPRSPSKSSRGWLRVMCQRTRAASSRVYWLSDRRVEVFIRSTRRL